MNSFPEQLKQFLGASTPQAPGVAAASANKEVFESVWKIVQECGEAERHFNQLQSAYRAVASTWLLATFGAVGYLMYDKDGKVAHPGIAATVCMLGALGIALLWMLDLQIYHKLLLAAFDEGYALEEHFAWLPRLRTNMVAYTRRAVRANLAIYYLLTTLAPLIVGLSLLCYYRFHFTTILLAAIPELLIVGFLFWTTRQEEHRGDGNSRKQSSGPGASSAGP